MSPVDFVLNHLGNVRVIVRALPVFVAQENQLIVSRYLISHSHYHTGWSFIELNAIPSRKVALVAPQSKSCTVHGSPVYFVADNLGNVRAIVEVINYLRCARAPSSITGERS